MANHPSNGGIGAAGLVLLAFLMVSLRRFVSLKVIQKERLDFKGIFILCLFMLTLTFGLVYYFEWVFFLVTWTYVICGVLKGTTHTPLAVIKDE